MSFADKVVFVTGAGQGMGRAIVRHFGAAGACVVAADINADAASAAVAELGAKGLALACNVADPASVDAGWAAFFKAMGDSELDAKRAAAGRGRWA